MEIASETESKRLLLKNTFTLEESNIRSDPENSTLPHSLSFSEYGTYESQSVARGIDPVNTLALEKEEESVTHKLSTFHGVYLPVIMSIYNTLMYIRFPWFVGCLGFGLTVGIFVLGFSISFLTTMSMSAICANGTVRGGGVYFILSRVMGPTLGGAVGVLTWLMNTVSGNLSVLGMLAPLQDAYDLNVFGSEWSDTFIMGTFILAAFTIISLLGTTFFEKLATPLFAFSIISVVVAVLGFFYNKEGDFDGFTGLSWQTFSDNFFPPDVYPNDPDTGTPATVMHIFAVFYPCVTGILVGANMSGDLKTPDTSIPRGTFLALFTSVGTYFALILLPAFSITREKLLNDYFVIQNLCFRHEIIVYAIVLTGFLAALSGMMGAARILQAIAKDDLIHPRFKYFAVGSGGVNDTPRRAIMATWFVNQVVLVVVEINVLAPLITQFFLVVYGVVNLAAFLQRIAGVVNFRPKYRYFHWSLSLLGFAGCVATMMVIDIGTAFGAIAIFAATAFAILWRGSDHINWGELSQALIYHTTRKFLLQLDISRSHVKYWRPEILLLTKSRRTSLPLISLGNALKKGGMYAIGSILVGDFDEMAKLSQVHFRIWSKFLHHPAVKLKAFPTITVGSSVLQASQGLLLTEGLGAMRPNTLLLGWPPGLHTTMRRLSNTPGKDYSNYVSTVSSTYVTNPVLPFEEQAHYLAGLTADDHKDDIHGTINLTEYGQLIHTSLSLGKNVILARALSSFDPLMKFKKEAKISVEVWIDIHLILAPEKTILGRYTALFALQMGYILSLFQKQFQSQVLVKSFKNGEEECKTHKKFLTELLDSVRVQGTIEVINVSDKKWTKPLLEQSWIDRCHTAGKVIMESKQDREIVRFIPMPLPKDPAITSKEGDSEEARMQAYFSGLRELSNDGVPTLYCRGVQNVIAIAL